MAESVGDISYPLYIMHLPLVIGLRSISQTGHRCQHISAIRLV
jgi:peptidoglycan/LPS O-acetylase OafA/YrhL